MAKKTPPSFVEMTQKLNNFWRRQKCLTVFSWDQPKGAATFSPYTFFWALDNLQHRTAYLEPCRRPADARYGDSPNRMGRYYQYQVFLKPAPSNIRDLYGKSLEALGIKLGEHELRYLEDDWESPTLGASGVGWEVWLDGLEITQFTYFQGFAGYDLSIIPVEITYGLERIAMYLQGMDCIFDLHWDHGTRYRDIFHLQFEKEFSRYHFEHFNTQEGFKLFEQCRQLAHQLSASGMVLPAYEYVMKCSEIFNNLEARGALSVEERNRLISQTRQTAKAVAGASREGLKENQGTASAS